MRAEFNHIFGRNSRQKDFDFAAKHVAEEKAQTPDAPRRRRSGHLLSASTSKETFGFSIVFHRSGVGSPPDSWFKKWSVNFSKYSFHF